MMTEQEMRNRMKEIDNERNKLKEERKEYEKYAECITLIDGYESNCWTVKAIKNQVIGLWTHNKLRLMNSETDPKVIDFYREISQEEFETLYREYNNDLKDKVYS